MCENGRHRPDRPQERAVTDQFAHDAARNDQLILVDGFDQQIGTATKERANLVAHLPV
jgi:hypothetical protein